MKAFVTLKNSQDHKDPPDWLKKMEGKFIEVEECTYGPAICGGKAYHVVNGPTEFTHVCEHALELSTVGVIQ